MSVSFQILDPYVSFFRGYTSETVSFGYESVVTIGNEFSSVDLVGSFRANETFQVETTADHCADERFIREGMGQRFVCRTWAPVCCESSTCHQQSSRRREGRFLPTSELDLRTSLSYAEALKSSAKYLLDVF